MNNTNINTQSIINIKDIKGIIHKWLIEEELNDSYRISCNGFITEISKKHTYLKSDILYTSDVRNPWCTLENKKYAKAEYCEIWLVR